MANTTLIHSAQVIGITLSGLASGSNLATSLIVIPALLKSPPKLLAQQWLELYDRGKVLLVPAAIGSSVAFAYLTWASSRKEGFSGNLTAQLYGTATAFAIGMAPYTQLLMMSGIQTLSKIAKGVDSKGLEAVEGLVRQWSAYNLGRGFIPLIAVVAGVWATSSGAF